MLMIIIISVAALLFLLVVVSYQRIRCVLQMLNHVRIVVVVASQMVSCCLFHSFLQAATGRSMVVAES